MVIFFFFFFLLSYRAAIFFLLMLFLFFVFYFEYRKRHLSAVSILKRSLRCVCVCVCVFYCLTGIDCSFFFCVFLRPVMSCLDVRMCAHTCTYCKKKNTKKWKETRKQKNTHATFRFYFVLRTVFSSGVSGRSSPQVWNIIAALFAHC